MTLNQKYKASGSTLSFKDWVENQKMLGTIDTKNQQSFEQNDNLNFSIGVEVNNNQKKVLIALGVLAVIGIGFWAYKKYRKG
jgi:hypothetical protein